MPKHNIIKQVGFKFKGKQYRAVESSNGWSCAFKLDRMPVLMFRVIRGTVVNRGGGMKSTAFINAVRKALHDVPIRNPNERSPLILPSNMDDGQGEIVVPEGTFEVPNDIAGLPDAG